MSAKQPLVFIVDDDDAVRRSLEFLVGSFGYATRAFASAEEFFNTYDSIQPGCLLLDIQMPGWTGLELQQRLDQSRFEIPIIFISGNADVPRTSRAIRAGAVDVLQKPVDCDLLKSRLDQALATDARQRARRELVLRIDRGTQQLTPRERDVMALMIEGRSIHQIAGAFSISHQTAARHRARVFEKMNVANDVELVQLMADARDGAP